jgi:hypothetical protein
MVRPVELSEVSPEQFRDLIDVVATNNLWDDALEALAKERVETIFVSTRATQVIQAMIIDLVAEGRLSAAGKKRAGVVLTHCACGSSSTTVDAGSDGGSPRGGVLPKGSSSPPM